MYIHVYVYICVYMYVYIYFFSYYFYEFIYPYTHMYMYLHTYMNVYIYTYIYTYIHIFTPICLYAHAHVFMYTYVQWYICTFRDSYLSSLDRWGRLSLSHFRYLSLISVIFLSFPHVIRVPLPLCTPGGRISYFWKNTHGDSQIFYFFINKQDDSKGV